MAVPEEVYIVDRDGKPAARIIRRSDNPRPFCLDGLEEGLSQDEFWRFGVLVRAAQVDHFEFRVGRFSDPEDMPPSDRCEGQVPDA